MDQKRKRLHEVIEKAAANRGSGSPWDLNPPKKLNTGIKPPKSALSLHKEHSK